MKPALSVFPGEYSILRFNSEDPLPGWILSAEFFSITRTPDELSIITDHVGPVPENTRISKNWRMIRINGQLDLGLVGIIAGITAILKVKNIPVFILSTFDTDYILVNKGHLSEATEALEQEGYNFK
jgi:hypothetical protein